MFSLTFRQDSNGVARASTAMAGHRFEITPPNLIDVWLSDGRVEVELIAIAEIDSRTAMLSGCHIQGPGPNTMGLSALRHVAQWTMELLDVDELRIEGAARTSGANPGRRPTPLVFRRADHVDPAA